MFKNTLKFLFLASVLSPMSVDAQGISVEQERLFNLKVVEALATYERHYATLDNQMSYSEFKDLFKDGCMVYNDLLGLSSQQSLSAAEYIELLKTKAEAVEMHLLNVQKGAIVECPNGWQMSLTMQKRQNYVMGCDLLLDSHEYYSADYNITMVFQWDTSTDQCHISAVEGAVESKLPMLGDQFVVLEKRSNRDERVYNGSSLIRFNTFDQCLIPNVTDKTLQNKLTTRDADVLVRVKDYDPDCHKAHLRYKSRRWQLRPHFDKTMGDYYKTDNPVNVTSTSKGDMEFGLDIGGFFPSKGVLKVGLFAGAGFAKSSLDMSLMHCRYAYASNADVDGDTYIRHYDNMHMQQRAEFVDVKAPLYLDFDIKLSRWGSVYLTAGAEAHYNLSAKLHLTEGRSTVYGVYPQYSDLVLDQHFGFNGFGEQTFSDANLYSDQVAAMHKFTYDIVGGAGVRINVPTLPLSVDVGVKYVYGMRGLINQTSENVLETGGRYPNGWTVPVHNEVYGMNSYEVVRSLTDSYWDIKRRLLRLNIGLIYKF